MPLAQGDMVQAARFEIGQIVRRLTGGRFECVFVDDDGAVHFREYPGSALQPVKSMLMGGTSWFFPTRSDQVDETEERRTKARRRRVLMLAPGVSFERPIRGASRKPRPSHKIKRSRAPAVPS